MKSLEHNLQVSCVKWFRLQYPKYLIYSIPNGGKRNVIEATRMKSSGTLAGVPDLHVPVPSGKYGSLYIEMKVKGNYPSKIQVERISQLANLGNKVEICYTFESFTKIIHDYFAD